MNDHVQLFFDVFKSPDDHLNWDKHIKFAGSWTECEEDKRRKWVKALEFLKQEFGKGFLKSSHRNHPLNRRITEKAQWRTTEIITIAETLNHLKNSNGNYLKLLEKIKPFDSCEAEGIPFLEIVQMYLKVGMQVYFPEEIKTKVTPDIRITCPISQDSFYIEVSKLDDDIKRNSIRKNYRQLENVFEFEGIQLPYSCAQLRYITEKEMDEVINKIKAARQAALNGHEIVFYIDDKIRLAIAHPAKYDQLINWIETNDFRKGLHGAPLNFDDTYRLANNKLLKEARQIPDTASGLVYILCNPLYFWQINEMSAFKEFEQKLKRLPNILGLVVYAQVIDDSEPFTQIDDGNIQSIKKINEVVSRYLFFVRNKNYKGLLSETTIQKIYRSFE